MSNTFENIEQDLKQRAVKKDLYGSNFEKYVYGTLKKIAVATTNRDRRVAILAPGIDKINNPIQHSVWRGVISRNK